MKVLHLTQSRILVTVTSINDNEVKDLKDKDALHLNDVLAGDNNADIEDIGVVHE